MRLSDRVHRQYYQTMDKFVTKTDNAINHTAVKVTAAHRMKLSSETCIQGFAETCSWMIDTKHFFSLSLIEAKLLFFFLSTIKDLFCWSQLHFAIPHNFPHNQHFLLHNLSPKSTQFNFFPAPCQMSCLILIIIDLCGDCSN